MQEGRQRLAQQIQDLQSQLQRWTVQETDAAQAQRTAEHELATASEKEQALVADLNGLQTQLPGREASYQSAVQALNVARDSLATMEQRLASLGERTKALLAKQAELQNRTSRLNAELDGMRLSLIHI